MIASLLKTSDRVLGLNERNIEYVHRFNTRTATVVADNKIRTKTVLRKHDIPRTKMIKIIRSAEELEKFDFSQLPKSFVVKPVNGVEGGGILIVYNTDKNGHYVTAQSRPYTKETMLTYMQDVLEGKYSHSYQP